MAVTYAAKAKAEGDVRALPQTPLRNPALAGLAGHIRLAQLGQSFFVRIRSDAASPIDVIDGCFSAGGTAPGQKGEND